MLAPLYTLWVLFCFHLSPQPTTPPAFYMSQEGCVLVNTAALPSDQLIHGEHRVSLKDMNFKTPEEAHQQLRYLFDNSVGYRLDFDQQEAVLILRVGRIASMWEQYFQRKCERKIELRNKQ